MDIFSKTAKAWQRAPKLRCRHGWPSGLPAIGDLLFDNPAGFMVSNSI
jgi:uncharacterized protein (DUF934 family)